VSAAQPSQRPSRLLGCLVLLLLVGLALEGLVIALVVVLSVFDWHDRRATERYVEALDAGATAAAPPGSPSGDARAWLASQGMFVSECGPELSDTGLQGHGLDRGELGGILVGHTRQGLWYGENDISVYFFLDKRGRVIKHLVHRFHIGL
jgi:hypothetical protein